MKLLSVVVIGAALAHAQFRVGAVINATAMPKGTVFLTFDDGPDEPGPDGVTQMQKVARYLHGPVKIPRGAGDGPRIEAQSPLEISIRATFATTTCHYQNQDKADPGSSMCYGYGDVSESVAVEVVNLGHDLINHSANHIPLTGITDPSKILYEVGRAQQEIDKLQDNSPRLFRAPGLAFNASVAEILNADSYTGKLLGPLDTDVGGDFYLGTTSWMGGDWDCFKLGLSVPACANLYISAIQSASHGVVVLLHVRTETMTGTNGDPYALHLIRYIIEHLGPSYIYLPLDAIPGVLGNTSAHPVHVSTEFSSSDGQSNVVAGAISGAGKSSGLCKARSTGVFCKTADGVGGFLPSTQWLAIADPTWAALYGSKFWLADINGDGRADLIFPASSTLFVAYNNGLGGFYQPIAYYCGTLPDLRYVHFGRVRPGGLPDMIVWTPDLTTPQIYMNLGVRFGASSAAPVLPNVNNAEFEAQLRFFQLIDINGDGLEDIVIPGGAQVWCVVSTGKGFAAPQPCSTLGGQFTDSQGWANPDYSATFAAVHININGPALAGGLPGGIIFTPIATHQSQPKISDRYRYLCNDCFTNSADPNWHPELRAAQIVWGDFNASGIDSPCLIRSDGLYCGLTSLAK